MPTVGDLIHSLDKEKVLNEVVRLFPGEEKNAEGYAKVWDTLLALQPKLTTFSVIFTSVTEEGEQWVHLSGIQSGDDQTYAIEYTRWEEWLSMPIILSENTQPMSDEEKLVHCLFEMTLVGYSQEDVQKQMDYILESVEELKDRSCESNKPVVH